MRIPPYQENLKDNVPMPRDRLVFITPQLQASSKNEFLSDISDCIDPNVAFEGDSDIVINPLELVLSHTQRRVA